MNQTPTPVQAETQAHTFIVTVEGCTKEQAATVMGERTGHDEDYGFSYTIGFQPSPGGLPDAATLQNIEGHHLHDLINRANDILRDSAEADALDFFKEVLATAGLTDKVASIEIGTTDDGYGYRFTTSAMQYADSNGAPVECDPFDSNDAALTDLDEVLVCLDDVSWGLYRRTSLHLDMAAGTVTRHS